MVEARLGGFLQDDYTPRGRCFGCGPANKRGLRLKSRWVDGVVKAEWSPQPHHEAIDGILSSGVIASLLDCSSNWAGAVDIMFADHLTNLPSLLTREFRIHLVGPAFTNEVCNVTSRVIDRRARTIEAYSELEQRGSVRATCTLISVIGQDAKTSRNEASGQSGDP